MKSSTVHTPSPPIPVQEGCTAERPRMPCDVEQPSLVLLCAAIRNPLFFPTKVRRSAGLVRGGCKGQSALLNPVHVSVEPGCWSWRWDEKGRGGLWVFFTGTGFYCGIVAVRVLAFSSFCWCQIMLDNRNLNPHRAVFVDGERMAWRKRTSKLLLILHFVPRLQLCYEMIEKNFKSCIKLAYQESACRFFKNFIRY